MASIKTYPRKWMGKPIKKVAIVGGSQSRKYAPFDDPTWDIWAFSNRRLPIPRVTRWYEIHAVQSLRRLRRTPSRRDFKEHWSLLRRQKCPVYMQRTHKDIPNSVAYPLDEAIAEFGRCFTSSASYAVAMAIMEGYQGIGLWGVDLTIRKHYVYQRRAIEYLLSVARIRGIKVYLPPTSRLKVPKRPRPVRTKILYGYDWNAPGAWWKKRTLRPRKKLRMRRRLCTSRRRPRLRRR